MSEQKEVVISKKCPPRFIVGGNTYTRDKLTDQQKLSLAKDPLFKYITLVQKQTAKVDSKAKEASKSK